MRILMISDFYWPFLGGVEQHVRTLSAALSDRGHDVTMATLWNHGLPAIELDGGVKVCRLKSNMQRMNWLYSKPERSWAPPFPDPAITLELRRIIAETRPDIVHGHDWLARSFLPIKRWSGAKLVVSLHYYTLSCAKKNLMYYDKPCSGPGRTKCIQCGARHYGTAKGVPTVLANWGMGVAERAMVDMFVPVSKATAEGNDLVESNVPLRIIPNLLPRSSASSHDSLEPYLSQLPDEEFLLFVGDLRPIKGIDLLLHVYGELDNPPPLVMIGKEWPDTPNELMQNAMVFHDWPNSAVLAAWKRSMIGLLPSVWPEPFGIVVIEAMAGASPVIGSSIGGISEIIVDGESGLLVQPGDSGALRRAIEKLLNNPGLRQKMGQAAKARAAEFEEAAVVPRIEAVYRDVLSL